MNARARCERSEDRIRNAADVAAKGDDEGRIDGGFNWDGRTDIAAVDVEPATRVAERHQRRGPGVVKVRQTYALEIDDCELEIGIRPR